MAHLAQLNIAHLAHDLDHPDLAPFVASLEPVNAMADAAPGFVWRLQEENGNATDVRPWGPTIIVNLSTWTDVESLREYVYSGAHVEVLRQRRAFFTPVPVDTLVLWWVPEGHRPSLVEAKERLDHLRAHGPTAHAFTLRVPFGADAAPAPAAEHA
ncbi:MAG: DUF3291 domain-containing protein [Frankiales bacterium]|nr:DUF3291 domain-containing protein [Frankiales bacterium]